MRATKRVAKNGDVTWTTVVALPAGLDGKRRQRRLSAGSKRELVELETSVRHQLQTGTYIEPSTAAVGAYLRDWLRDHEAAVRPGTAFRYEVAIERYIDPTLGSVPLQQLTPMMVQGLYTKLSQAGIGASSILIVHGILRQAFARAVKLRLMVVNPTEGVERPRKSRHEMQTWTAPQVRHFLDGNRDDRLVALFRLAITTGMRQGELRVLRWSDIDLERGTVAVRRTASRTRDGGWGIGEPKTEAGRRSIPLSASCLAALRQHRSRQNQERLAAGPAWQDADLVFTDLGGKIIAQRTLAGRFKLAALRLGLPEIRFHDLRHTAATLMLEQGVHPKVVQERLGHSNIQMTLNLYSHVSESLGKQAAETLAEAIGE